MAHDVKFAPSSEWFSIEPDKTQNAASERDVTFLSRLMALVQSASAWRKLFEEKKGQIRRLAIR